MGEGRERVLGLVCKMESNFLKLKYVKEKKHVHAFISRNIQKLSKIKPCTKFVKELVKNLKIPHNTVRLQCI